MTELPRLRPHDDEFHTDPYALYARYRREDPVHWGEPYAPGAPGCWYLFRHDHVVALLRDRRFRRKAPASAPPTPAERPLFVRVLDRLLLSTDPPEHRRLRTLASAAFGARAVESYRPLVAQVAHRFVDALPRTGEFDLIEDFAAPLSFSVICAVLGVPTDAVDDVRRWITRFGDGLDLRKDPNVLAAADAGTAELLRFFAGIVAARRAEPRADLVSALVQARDDGDRLSEDELLAMCIQLIFAGHDTTVGQIGTTMLNLLAHPAQLAAARDSPPAVEAAVRESLRLTGSVHTAAARKPVEDVRIGDRLIRAGEPVIAFIGAANRDPAVFDAPDRFDPTRDNTAAIPFGAGIHYCLGAALGRLETEVAVNTLLNRVPHLRMVTNQPVEYRTNIVLPVPAHITVRGWSG